MLQKPSEFVVHNSKQWRLRVRKGVNLKKIKLRNQQWEREPERIDINAWEMDRNFAIHFFRRQLISKLTRENVFQWKTWEHKT